MKWALVKTFQCGCKYNPSQVGTLISIFDDINKAYKQTEIYNETCMCKCRWGVEPKEDYEE